MGLCADGSATSLHPEAPGMETAVDLGGAVGRAQQGDAEAFRLLYRDIQPRPGRSPRAAQQNQRPQSPAP